MTTMKSALMAVKHQVIDQSVFDCSVKPDTFWVNQVYSALRILDTAEVPIKPTEAMIRAACLYQSDEKFNSYESWAASHSNGVVEMVRKLVTENYRVMVLVHLTVE